jgi:hypothetical protein
MIIDSEDKLKEIQEFMTFQQKITQGKRGNHPRMY